MPNTLICRIDIDIAERIKYRKKFNAKPFLSRCA